MSLPRKDVRFKLDDADFTRLSVYCAAHDLQINDFCETVIRREVRQLVHKANVVAEATRGLRDSGNDELPDGPQLPL